MTPLLWIMVLVVGALSGVITAIVVDWRGWRDLYLDVRRHGIQNDRFCDVAGCCR